MKVALLNEKYFPYISGGAERSLKVLAEALPARGATPVVITVCPGPAERTAVVDGVRVHSLPVRNFFWPVDGRARPRWKLAAYHLRDSLDRSRSREIRRMLERIGPDVVHTNNLSGLGILTWRAAKSLALPVVHTLRDHYLMCPFSVRHRRGRDCPATCLDCVPFALRNRRLSRLVDVAVGNSRDILEPHLAAGYFACAGETRVIYNASATSCAGQPGAPAEPGVVTFAFLGRITREKGIENLLAATRSLPDRGWRLLIAGDGVRAYVERLRTRFSRRNISWLGWVDPAEIYRAADWVIVPSLWREPLPRVILEAHGCGVPVAASNRGGIPEVVAHGRTGLLYDPAAPAALAGLLKRLADGEWRAADFRSACISAAARYRPGRMAGDYLRAYAKAAALTACRGGRGR